MARIPCKSGKASEDPAADEAARLEPSGHRREPVSPLVVGARFCPHRQLHPLHPEELTADLDLLGATPEQFIEAMIQSGFPDCSQSSSPESGNSETLCIHDWPDYNAQSLVVAPRDVNPLSPLLPAWQYLPPRPSHGGGGGT